ncbi:hypothetical protein [Ensifer adhaerens]|uniref:hypothetical protein n=1 Tax=Ensifer adhaerens TaxID=106592 RepID=UPI000CF0588B|nr:hypothetical protein [Ensifer adhaerens]
MEKGQKKRSLAEDDRREFLIACGRFAAFTPPTVTMLLSTSLTSEAIAKSGSGGGSKGRGDGGKGDRGKGKENEKGRGKGEGKEKGKGNARRG